MKISIVIPVYGGEKTIGPLVDQLVVALKSKYVAEVVLVNDCSPDNSEKECIALHKKYPGIVKFYSLAKNTGEHNAVMAGLNKTTGDFAVIMDDDFQNPISEVLKLIDYATQHEYDVVYTYYPKKKHSSYRNFGSWLNGKMANVMLGKPKYLYLSSFKILNRFLINEIIKYTAPFSYIDGLVLRTTANIGKIEVEHRERKDGKSGYTFIKLFKLWSNMFINHSILPLRAAIVLGIFASILGFLFAVYTVLEKIANPALPLGYPALAVLLLFFGGIQLIVLGMAGEYVGRIFLSQNKTPQYTIKKSFE